MLRRSSSTIMPRSFSTTMISPTKPVVASSTTMPRSATTSTERPRGGLRQSPESTSVPYLSAMQNPEKSLVKGLELVAGDRSGAREDRGGDSSESEGQVDGLGPRRRGAVRARSAYRSPSTTTSQVGYDEDQLAADRAVADVDRPRRTDRRGRRPRPRTSEPPSDSWTISVPSSIVTRRGRIGQRALGACDLVWRFGIVGHIARLALDLGECQRDARKEELCLTTAVSTCSAPSSRTTSRRRSRSARARWSSATTWASRRRRSATTWSRSRTRATSPSPTPAPVASRPTRATGCSSTGWPRSSRCRRQSVGRSRRS